MIRPRLRRFFIPKPVFILHVRRNSSLASLSFTPSKEQLEIVQACKTHNCVVSARPGSGKTSTAEVLVHENRDKKTLILTYSKRLQLSTSDKLSGYGSSVDVATFHSMAGRLFGRRVENDEHLRNLRRTNAMPKPRHNFRHDYDFVVLDELQDMTEELYWLSCRLLKYLVSFGNPKILLIGDSRQAIYEYRGADARYLEYGEDLFSEFSPHNWRRLTLSQSFRLSRPIANFVNLFINEKDYIVGTQKENEKAPVYVVADVFKTEKLGKYLQTYIKDYRPGEVAILAPHLQNNKPLALLENWLSDQCKIPISVATSDDFPLIPETLEGKLAFSTFHQFKGIERPLTIVFGIQDSHFDYMGRYLPDDRCPNDMFVALTRASDQLVVVQTSESTVMPFVPRWEELKNSIRFGNLSDQAPRPQPKVGRNLRTDIRLPRDGVAVVDLIRHVREEALSSLVKDHLNVVNHRHRMKPIQIEDMVLTDTDNENDYYEAVSDLNGLAITAAFEYETTGRCTTLGIESPQGVPSKENKRAKWFAEKAAEYVKTVSRYKSRWVQLKEKNKFNWLHSGLRRSTSRLKEQFLDPHRLQFERDLFARFGIEKGDNILEPQKTKIKGRADIYDPGTNDLPPAIWEIKFVTSLNLGHIAQLAIYGYQWCIETAEKMGAKADKSEIHPPRLILFNVYNGQMKEIKASFKSLEAFTEGILRAKYTPTQSPSTDQFLQICAAIRETMGRNMMRRPKDKKKKRKKKKKSSSSNLNSDIPPLLNI